MPNTFQEPRRYRDEGEPDGEQHLVEFARAIEPPVEHPLERHADDRGREERDRQRGEERPPELVHQRHRDVAADHGERTVGQVDEVHHPERDGQSHREEEQQHAVGESVEQDADERCDHRNVTADRLRLGLVWCTA
jgi:hypothetical protein